MEYVHNDEFPIEMGMDYDKFFKKLKDTKSCYIPLYTYLGKLVPRFYNDIKCGDPSYIKMEREVNEYRDLFKDEYAEDYNCRALWHKMVKTAETYRPMTMTQESAYLELLKYLINVGYTIAFFCGRKNIGSDDEIVARMASEKRKCYCTVNDAKGVIVAWKRMTLLDMSLSGTYEIFKGDDAEMLRDIAKHTVSDEIRLQCEKLTEGLF